ncbi:MAG: class B sortase [Bacilli bacterium]
MFQNSKGNKKSKNRLKKKKNILVNRIIFGVLIFLVLFLIIFLICKFIHNQQFYNVVDRTIEIEKYKKEQNYTIVGWLKVQGTNIDYPVLFYDDAPIDDVTADIGWTYHNVQKLDDRTIIEGHNILNLSSNPKIANKNSKRFEQLLSFYDINFAKNNKYIEYSLNNENYVFKIFAVSFPEIEAYYTKFKYTKEEMKDYIDTAKKESLYDYEIDVDENDKIISLYTCTRFFGYEKSVVFRIDARLLRKNEKINNYNLKETNNYKTAKSYAEYINKSQEVKS